MVPPDVIDIMASGYKSIVTGAQGTRGLNHLCSRKRHTPPGACIMASLEGVTPQKMTSFLWSHIAHNLTKARL